MRDWTAALVVAIVCGCVCFPAYAADAEMDARIVRLAALLRTDSSYKVRAYAARQLGALSTLGAKRDQRVVAALSEGIRDDDPVVRALSADAIGRHEVQESLQILEKLAVSDQSELVRRASSSAVSKLKSSSSTKTPPTDGSRTKKPRRVELGKVELVGSPPLVKVVTDAIEELIEPHRPAMFPRESPNVRLEVSVTRTVAKSNGPGVGLAYEAHCVLVELPGAQLRKASNATASATTTKRGSSFLASLEKELALKAATRAVTEALAMLDE